MKMVNVVDGANEDANVNSDNDNYENHNENDNEASRQWQ